MSFLAALLALLLEQLRPLPSDNAVQRAIDRATSWARRHWDAGQRHHAVLVWTACVVLPALLSALIFITLWRYSALLALLWDVAVLYLCLGFRQFSHRFTAIREALEQRDDERAWSLLAQWSRTPIAASSGAELLRRVTAQGLISAHRHVFGVFFCFIAFSALGLGPAGALLYRGADRIGRDEHLTDEGPAVDEGGHMRSWSRQAFAQLDYLPARMTAACFAMAGNFEEAVSRWRQDRDTWTDANEGLIVSVALGAAGPAFAHQDTGEALTEPATSAQPAIALQAVVALVWRSLVLAMLLVALLSLANLLG